MTRHAHLRTEVKWLKVKVTRSRNMSAARTAITRQWMVASSSNLVGIITVRGAVCNTLSSSVEPKKGKK